MERMTAKSDVVNAVRTFREKLEEIAGGLTEDGWSRQVYPRGWTARQLLAHVASTSGVAGFALMLSRAPGGAAGAGGAYDIDQFNQQQVALREGRSVAELLGEVRSNTERDIAAIEAASEEELSRAFRAPWDVEGPLGSGDR
jgi:uncharacterized protein (TIGR03083 family)